MKLILLAISIGGPIPLIVRTVPTSACYHVLAAIFFIVSVIAAFQILITRSWKLSDLGFTTKYFDRKSLLIYGFFAGLSVLTFFLLYGHKQVNEITLKTAFLSLTVSATQEIMYRGCLMKVGEEIFGPKLWIANIAVNVALFTYMHNFYPQLEGFDLVLIGSAGAMFSTLYHFRPNIYLVIILHFLTNLQAIYLGMFNS